MIETIPPELPLPQEDATGYGIISISVANMRREPRFQSELVNQTVMGTIVAILDEERQFYYCRNWDGYLGWISKLSVQPVSLKEAQGWRNSMGVFINENYGVVTSSTDKDSEILTDLVACIRLRWLGPGEDFYQVQLPDGRTGYIPAHIATDIQEQRLSPAWVSSILHQARKFLGIPYLWGGTSTKGFDCSGFVQTVFRIYNVILPRDSRPMATVGIPVAPQRKIEELSPGDLLFFGESEEKINHVALYEGDGYYLHARGRVRRNSLLPDDPLFDEYLYSLWVTSRRVLK